MSKIVKKEIENANGNQIEITELSKRHNKLNLAYLLKENRPKLRISNTELLGVKAPSSSFWFYWPVLAEKKMSS